MLQATLSGAILVGTGAVSAAVGAVLWQRQAVFRARLLAVVLFMASYYALVSGLETLAADPSVKVLLSKLEHVAVNALGPLFVLLARSFIRPAQRLRRGAMVLLWAMPAVNLAMAATNEWHNLIWSGFSPGPPGSNMLIYHYGPWFYVTVATVYLYLAAATFWLFRWAQRRADLQRRQVAVVLLAMAIPWVASVLYVFRLVPVEGLNLTPMAFAGTAAILAWSLFPARPFELVPLARRTLVESLPDGMLVLDAEGQVVDTNPAADELLGLPGDATGLLADEMVQPWPELKAELAATPPRRAEVRCGQDMWLEVRTRPLHGGLARLEGTLVVLRDVTERVRAEERIRSSEKEFRDLVESALVGVYRTNLAGEILYVNDVMWRMFGYTSAEEFIATGAAAVYKDPADRAALIQELKEAGQVTEYEFDAITKQGAVRRMLLSGRLSGNTVTGMIMDITDRRRAEEALRESEERFRLLFERLADAVFITEDDGRILEANEAAVAQTGYSREELKGLNVMRELASEEPADTYARIRAALDRGETAYFEEPKRRKDGNLYWTECALSPIELGGRSCVLSVNRDITARKKAEERLHYLSTHDSLTGAYNRAYFEEEMARLSRGRRFPVGVFVSDVNGLKTVNDRDGHAAGDELLQRAFQVLRAAVRGEDVVARIGGDEFAGLLPQTDADAAQRFAARVRACLQEHNAGHSGVRLSIALGVATATPDETLDAALREADARMYEDKSAGGSR
ncbi:MAG: PAS domain S-box protein [Candidatus Bipolaricaulota bacterium]